MATQTEEVVVNLKVNSKGVETFNTDIKKTAENTTNLNASIGKVTASLGSWISNTVKLSVGMRVFNKLAVDQFVGIGKIQNITKSNVATQDEFAKNLINITIPALEKYIKRLGFLAAGVVGTIGAFKLWTISLKTTEDGAATLATVMTSLQIVLTDIIKDSGEAGEVLGEIWQGFLDDMREVIPLLDTLLKKIDEEMLNANEFVQLQSSALQFTQDRLTLEIERRRSLSEAQTELLKQNKTMEEQITLTERIGLIQAELAGARDAELQAQIDALQFQKDELTPFWSDQVKLQTEINTLELKRQNGLTKEQEILDRIAIKVQAIRDSFKPDEPDEAGRGDAPVFIDFDAEAEALEKLLLEGYVPFVEGFKFMQRDRFDAVVATLDAIEDAEEESIESRSKADERAIRAQMAWDEFGAENKLKLGAMLFGAAADLAKDNFELQKAFAIGETVMNTAAGIVKVWRNPGYPIAIPLTALVVAQGAAAISQIASAQPGQTGSILNPTFTTSSDNTPSNTIESASNSFFTRNQQDAQNNSVVLVTEDLSTVQNRVAVTEDRASIG